MRPRADDRERQVSGNLRSIMNRDLLLVVTLVVLLSACGQRSAGGLAPVPESFSMNLPDERAPDGPMDAEQQARADALTPAQVEAIDRELLRASDLQWRKVARVVGTVMFGDWPGKPDGLADVFYAQRVAGLVRAGKLQAQGDLARMRFSEVRLTPLTARIQ